MKHTQSLTILGLKRGTLSKKSTKKRTPFSKLVTKLRKQNRLTMTELSHLVGVSESYISLLESGARQNPSRDLVIKLSKSLGAQSNNQLADDLLVAAGYYPSNKQVYNHRNELIQSYQAALKDNPEDFQLYTALIFALIKTNQSEKAQQMIQEGFQLFKNTIELQSLLASLELSKNKFQEALNYQKFAIEQLKQQNNYPESYLQRLQTNLGIMYFLKGDQHINNYLLACEQKDQQRQSQEKSLALQNLEIAKDILKKITQINPDNIYNLDEYARVLFNLAYIQDDPGIAQPLWQETITYLKKVLYAPNNYTLGKQALLDTSIFLAHAYSKSQQFELAKLLIHILQITAPPDYWMISYLKACFYSLQYESEKDARLLDQSLELLTQALQLSHDSVLPQINFDPDLRALRQYKQTDFNLLLKKSA